MVIGKEELYNEIIKYSDCIAQQLKAKKYNHIYGDTCNYINNTYSGVKFTEKCHKYIYGEDLNKCKSCNANTKFISFFKGYHQYCSKKCSIASDTRVKKIKNTKLYRYGDSNYNNVEKSKKTCLEKYGVNNAGASLHSIEKAKNTRIKKYGSYSYNNLEKYIETNKRKYGEVHFTKLKSFRLLQSEKLKNSDYQLKMKNGFYKKYGVYYPSQVSEFFEKSKYKYTPYELPSGKVIKLQGYEYITINELLKIYNENEIIYKQCDMPEIWYDYQHRKHRYYPDFYIPTDNLIVETKSEFTYNADISKNEAKFKAVKDLGYKFELKIYKKQ